MEIAKRADDFQADTSSKKTRTAKARAMPHDSKPRAWVACHNCRQRKVRCNVLQGRRPCTNCLVDRVDCKMPYGRKNSRASRSSTVPDISYSNSVQQFGPISGSEWELPEQSNQFSGRIIERGYQLPHQIPRYDTTPLLPLYQSSLSDSLEGAYYYQGQSMSDGSTGKEGGVVDHSPVDSYSDHLCSRNSDNGTSYYSARATILTPPRGIHSISKQSKPQSNRLPKYISALPVDLNTDDILYLNIKGALTIPPLEVRDALVQTYIDFVYPFMPVLNLEKLLSCIEGEFDGGQNISLLVLQAIMFAGSAFVGMPFLEQIGFSSRREARKFLFQKVKVLYYLDCERDTISLVQGLLIMSSWSDKIDGDRNDSSYWLGLAISQIQALEFYPKQGASKQYGKSPLERRMWWSCFVQDRIVALSNQCRTQIPIMHNPAYILCADDFSIIFSKSNLNSAFLKNATLQRQLARMFIEQVKLFCQIDGVLSESQPIFRHGDHEPIDMVLNGRLEISHSNIGLKPYRVQESDEAIMQWARDLPPGAEFQRPNTDPFDECLVVHRAQLRMVYFLARIHPRHDLLYGKLQSSRADEEKECSVKRARGCALEISRLCEDVYELNIVRYLPSSAVTVVLLAAIIHLHDTNSASTGIRTVSLQRYIHCMHVIQRLRQIHPSADIAAADLEEMISNAKAAWARDLGEQTSHDMMRGLGDTIDTSEFSPQSRTLSLLDHASFAVPLVESQVPSTAPTENPFPEIASTAIAMGSGGKSVDWVHL